MDKIHSTGNRKWIVQICRSKKLTSKKRVGMKVEIRRSRTFDKDKDGHDSMKQFIDRSKEQVDTVVKNSIIALNKWRRDTFARFDIVQMHLFQNYVISESTKINSECFVEPPGCEQKLKDTITLPSMPSLFDDMFSKGEVLTKTSTVVKRPKMKSQVKSTVMKQQNDMYLKSFPQSPKIGIPLRKKSRFIHSSVLALSKDLMKFDYQLKTGSYQTSTETKTMSIEEKHVEPKLKKEKIPKKKPPTLFEKMIAARKLYIQQHKHENKAKKKMKKRDNI